MFNTLKKAGQRFVTDVAGQHFANEVRLGVVGNHFAQWYSENRNSTPLEQEAAVYVIIASQDAEGAIEDLRQHPQTYGPRERSLIDLMDGLADERAWQAAASDPASNVAVLADSVKRLRFALTMRLVEFYSQTYGDETNWLCAAIANYVVAEEPSNDNAKQYKINNHALIEREAAKLHSLMPDLEKVLSYLYAAEILHLSMLNFSAKDKKWGADKMIELTNRATELHIEIPNQSDICGKSDTYSCAQAIASFAQNIKTNRAALAHYTNLPMEE
jgi:hypothetical protein